MALTGTVFWKGRKPLGFAYVPHELDPLKASQGKTFCLTEGERDAGSLQAVRFLTTKFDSHLKSLPNASEGLMLVLGSEGERE